MDFIIEILLNVTIKPFILNQIINLLPLSTTVSTTLYRPDYAEHTEKTFIKNSLPLKLIFNLN